MDKGKQIEMILWSIALPGFAQFLNGKIVKGIVFIFLEFLINVQANLNTVIIHSFHGEMQQAIELANYQWLMFYPCLYLFAIWDAYRDAGGNNVHLSFLPFVFSAYVGTIGVIFSPNIKILGFLIGPIFLPIIFLVLGIILGSLVRSFLLRYVFIQSQG